MREDPGSGAPSVPVEPLVSGAARLLVTGVVLVRVAIITLVWLGLFLLMFLGYLTVPIVLIVGTLAIYAAIHWLRSLRPSVREQPILRLGEHPADASPRLARTQTAVERGSGSMGDRP